MGSVLLRTIQVLVATMLIAVAIIAVMWMIGLIDPVAVKTSVYRIGGVLGICLLAAIGMVAVFSIGGKNSDK